MNYIPKVDKQLLVRAKQHDEQAIIDIINIIDRPCHKIAMGYTFSYGLSSADADDIAQEAYIKVFQKLDTLENEDGFCAWLNIVVNNTAKDFLKKKEIKYKDAKFSELDQDEFNESFESTIENNYSQFEPQANVDYSALKKGMEECLNELPSNEKSTLYKFYFENRKIGEIAEEMDANQNTIKTWLYRGKKNLETMLVSLQKKDAAFYGIGAIPFFVWMLNEELDASCTVKAAEVAKIIVATTNRAPIKVFLSTAKGKVITTVVAIAIAAGGVGAYHIFSRQNIEQPKTVQKTTTKKKIKTKSKIEQTKSDEETSTHTHDWVAQYKTVHHDAVKQMQTVVDQEAYDEPVYSTRTVTKIQFCDYTGKYFDSAEEAIAYMKALGYGTEKSFGTPVQVEEQYQSGTIHHDAVTHQEEVVVQAAYDEQVLTGYTCSECGEAK